MRLLKFLAVISALGFLVSVVAYGGGNRLGSTKSGRLPKSTPLEGKDSGTEAPEAAYLNSTKAGPMPVPQQQQQAR